MSDKDKIIRQIYYDVDTGFGSINETYQNAKKILNTITYNDVKDFLERQKSRQFKKYHGYNSYVASKPLQELQIDLGDFTKSGAVNDGYRYMFLAVDIFSKYIHCVPVKDKEPPESIRAFKEVLNVIGIPENVMSDREGAWESTEFIKLLNENKIKHITSSSPPPFSERAVQEIKNMIHTRLEGLEKNRETWTEILPAVLKKYNNRIHGTIEMTPIEARKPENQIQVFFNIRQKAQFKRKYPDLKMSDQVRTYIKPHTFKKGWDTSWSKEIYKIIHISADGKQFLVNDNKRKVYNRWELLKIRGAEGKDD
mgnify:CR=1 FL=1